MSQKEQFWKIENLETSKDHEGTESNVAVAIKTPTKRIQDAYERGSPESVLSSLSPHLSDLPYKISQNDEFTPVPKRNTIEKHKKIIQSINSKKIESKKVKRVKRPSKDDEVDFYSEEDKWWRMICGKRKSGAIIPKILPNYLGPKVTQNFMRQNGFKVPFVVLVKDGLDIEIPHKLSPQHISDEIGPQFQIDVIDVKTQGSLKFTMQDWIDYFCSPLTRNRIYNLISLEFSSTPLAKYVRRPRIVREMDLSDICWPDARLEAGEFPAVQLYLLMSVACSYTDFHIDFGGTSVYYHVIKGSKLFYLIPPTPANLMAYEKWSQNSSKSGHRSEFFGDDVENSCEEVCLRAGNTLFIPSGWIHAVYTTTDSIVIGGNFLHLGHMEMQIAVHRMEIRTGVDLKFRFPYFEDSLWYAAVHYAGILFDDPSLFSRHEIDQLKKLCAYLISEEKLPPTHVTHQIGFAPSFLRLFYQTCNILSEKLVKLESDFDKNSIQKLILQYPILTEKVNQKEDSKEIQKTDVLV